MSSASFQMLSSTECGASNAKTAHLCDCVPEVPPDPLVLAAGALTDDDQLILLFGNDRLPAVVLALELCRLALLANRFRKLAQTLYCLYSLTPSSTQVLNKTRYIPSPLRLPSADCLFPNDQFHGVLLAFKTVPPMLCW